MIFSPVDLVGAYHLSVARHEDERGFFARTWCRDELIEKDLDSALEQCSISFNSRAGTLRGMHYQLEPFQETKIVRCTSGSIYDVIIDLRPGSVSYLCSVGFELSAENRNALYIPKGCAHGFLTLQDNTEVFYHISEKYSPENARGVRFDDPLFDIDWPGEVTVINDRDANYENFQPA